jgi:hypothetical protein
MELNCKFLIEKKCSLGWFGGNPNNFNCFYCIKNNDNTPEAKQKFDEQIKKAHPADKPMVSGCCDRADQA